MDTLARYRHLLEDVGIVTLSVLVAVILVQTGIIDRTIAVLDGFSLVGVFIAGMFFTSVFTTAPAIATLGEMATTHHPLVVAIIGGAGALCGDLVIFRFVRDRFADDLGEVFSYEKPSHRIRALMHMKFFRWFAFFFGGLILASPLPDELGISLMSFSKVKMHWFIPIAYLFNVAGILMIGLVARGLLF